ncbi:NAD-dependent dihydropyrimidine dehydrogenase subunit PreA [Deinococcus metallilatus]|uniref:dihydrouracil dehydrogenase (NAD(+)) n=1 Tax=Deinococcus metallilatus TaxID=1211322 RepID=A0AAJ5F3Z2_9DEIO|nr:NAD-dependent dihydropyrimidine dehydrogenase subunit PreA [Deinococcus metallilatus]MBB5294942.1 dihydropyrimidine dehydrogenase (NAD+) subunit PreA [Deinococcus metallilatus]QBY09357.1 NAD-dependent dihydropyrimidine dehydrogenase subunit PreA [Deinococcus metallilatus]RXJ09362.1 NAD-dependent dihydropyrimidine dehydrogenase subunit PreA [Deinococcus metallilatus]TLK28884.1 NAD-dependent dihydropyrimidine dehydrogenase subunit PreA [Deinococcus metallilatus]GMA16873.1 dihydropyrimidine de
MADLSVNFAGIRAPNPFWLASAPPTNSGAQIHRAFEYGWGGAVWKTIGAPVLNISNRYGGLTLGGQRLLAINNVELISDRPLEVNLREIAEIKRLWPDRALIVSAMVDADPAAWREIVMQIEDTGADGIELNYGCPQGMSERGMGAAVGQVPEMCQLNTYWVTSVTRLPVIVKLTPNVTRITDPAHAALAGGAHALSLINTINSVMKVDLDTLLVTPSIGGQATHGGYAGPAVKPIALHMLSELMCDPTVRKSGVPICGMGGIQTWRDAAEFLLLGASALQVCTAAMHYGYRIVEDFIDGLSNWMDDKGFASIPEVTGRSLPQMSSFGGLDLGYQAVARIDPDKCIRCDLCYVACNDTAHQCIDLYSPEGVRVNPGFDIRDGGKHVADGRPRPVIREPDCVGCALCANVCPVDGCIEMVSVPSGRPSVTWDELTATRPAVTQEWGAMEAYREEAGIEIH